MVRPLRGEPVFSRSAEGATQNLSKADMRRVVDAIVSGWHPASQARVHVLETAEEVPAYIK
jgi:hypothetical protein